MDWEPNTDVVIDESSRLVLVRAEVAAADSDSLRVSVDGRFLLISGCRAKNSRLRGGSYLQKEIPEGAFIKRLRLPVAVQYEETSATYADGMLTIELPIAVSEYIPTSRTEIRMIIKRVPA